MIVTVYRYWIKIVIVKTTSLLVVPPALHYKWEHNITVGKDHSPQDEIVLYGIEANSTTVATTHATVNTKEASTYDELLLIQSTMEP